MTAPYPLRCPPQEKGSRVYQISERQLYCLMQGWTHTSLSDKKNILHAISEDNPLCASHTPAPQQRTPEPCKGCTDPNQCYTPCVPAEAQQRIEQVIKELEIQIADQKETIATTHGHHKEIHECISNALEYAIALLRDPEEAKSRRSEKE